MLVTLKRPNGLPVPFGAIATSSDPVMSGIVDETSTVYLSGIGETAQLTVKWGNGTGQQCRASITQQSANQTESPNGIRSVNELCQQE
ncbi:FimD/PapC C-terminal domain-containing protein [Enterobacter asburiae]